MVEWQRKRRPEEVPAPVAIALSDYCRRAESPGSADQVREALCLLEIADDARVRELAAGEPLERPLGPLAVIDLLMGTPAKLAAERQRTGYYELVRQLLSPLPEPVPSAPPPARATPRPALPLARVTAPPPGADERPRRSRKAKAKEASLQERIAPRRKTRGAKDAPPAAPMPPQPASWKKRELPAPRGRYSTVSAVKQKTESLKEARSKSFLEGLLAQSETRHGVWKALSAHYASRGRPIGLHEVEEALEHHGLLSGFAEKEREAVLSQVAQARGGLERAARALGLKSKAELLALAKAVGAKKQVEDLRERFVREALSPEHLPLRLDLAGKFKYLADLGIARQFDTALARDLKELFGKSPHPDVFEVSRRTGFNAEMLERAATRLGLLQP